MLEMEACWPSGVVLRGRAPNRPVLRWLKTVVVSDREKARLTRQVGTRKTFQKAPGRGVPGWACAVEASLAQLRWHQKRGVWLFSCDEPGGRPDDWPGGARREGGVSLVCGSCTEREKASVESVVRVAGPKVARGSVPRQKPKALSTGRGARWRTGP